MLVTRFGYTSYRNAKFGQIQVHERITETSRELLMQIKEMAENMGYEVLHGIVDCLWVIGEPVSVFKEAVWYALLPNCLHFINTACRHICFVWYLLGNF
ncbi:MAG: hypothetical protein ABR985_21245 [Methanotrichaceae archaeon]|jgi:DNA polymerase I